jgi:glycopeptide antibiotics resistance protein
VKNGNVNQVRLVIKSLAWLSILLVFLVTVVPIGFRPSTGFSPNIERFGVMAVVGALFAAAYPRRFWLIVLGLSLAAAGFELLQILAGGRHPSIRDVGFKSLGAVIGAMLGYAVGVALVKAETLPEAAPIAAPEG